MKIHSLLFATITSLALTVPSLVSAIGPRVTVTVQDDVDLDRQPLKEKKAKGKGKNDAVVEEREVILKIEVRNIMNVAYPGAEVKYWMLTRIDGKGEAKVSQQGSMPLDITEKSTKQIESEAHSFEFTPKYYEKKGKKRYTEVEASGEKYAGFVVRVMYQNEVIGEAASTEAIKKLVTN